MHELSIALSMIERIEEEATKHSGRVLSAQVKVGVLSGVDCEALKFAWEIARAGTDLEGTQLEIESVGLLVRCPACCKTYSPEIQSLFCPDCITPAQDILSGRELELTTLEIDA
jgi:hydrogenase nickel incorporation protein HypA/HybF